MDEKNNIFYHLNKLYSTNGREINSWKKLLFTLNNNSLYQDLIQYFRQRIINEPSNILTLDILDFLIDYGPINLLRELSKIDLMIHIFNLLKKSSGSSLEVQKKGIFLIKKWFEIANNYSNENLEGFIRNYHELNNKGISFPPPDYKLDTYEQYISKDEINNLLQNINKDNNNLNNNINNNQDFNNRNFKKCNNQIIPLEKEYNNDNNYNDIPLSDMPKLNNFQNQPNYEKNKNFNNNFDNQNYFYNEKNNNDYNNNSKLKNFSKDNYFVKDEQKRVFEENKILNIKKNEENINESNPFKLLNQNIQYPEKFEDKYSNLKYSFLSNNKESINEKVDYNNIENNKYPEYNEEKNKINIENLNQNESLIGVDLFCAPNINETKTPFGNKNPMPISNKKYNTIYNNGFKSYMEATYGANNTNNNNINNNLNNNYENNFNKPSSIQFNKNQFNYNNDIDGYNKEIYIYKNNWTSKISLYNDWMNRGFNDKNESQLKIGIKNIIYEYDKIESLLQEYNQKGDFESVSTILKIKSDMNQTCYRYERLIKNQSYENFYSAFDGNIQLYTFNKDLLLSYLDTNDQNDQNNKYVEGIKKFGGKIKKGIFTAGKAVKDKTIKGLNFVKDKVNKDKNDNFTYNNQNNLNRQNNYSNVYDYSNSNDFNYNINNNINNPNN